MDEHAEIIRSMWRHEDTIANHRLTWFNAIQGLLFAALALAFSRNAPPEFKLILGFVGLVSCALTLTSMLLGARAKDELNKWWKNHQNGYKGPPIVGYYGSPGSMIARLLGYFAPSVLLPVMFLIAWLGVLVYL